MSSPVDPTPLRPTPSMDPPLVTDADTKKKEIRRVVLSSYLGSTIEYYDFLLYATAAAIVFAPVFFSDLDACSRHHRIPGDVRRRIPRAPARRHNLRSLRGHRYGRKSMLLVSMTVMGIASFLIGLVPPASAIGSWAAIILVLLRVSQGIAIGGEWGGATLMSLEHVGGRGRGFAAAFTNAGAPTGSLLGTIALAIVAAAARGGLPPVGLAHPVPTLGVLLALGLFIRSRVSESPAFKEALARRTERDSATVPVTPPLMSILRRPKNVVLVAEGCMASVANTDHVRHIRHRLRRRGRVPHGRTPLAFRDLPIHRDLRSAGIRAPLGPDRPSAGHVGRPRRVRGVLASPILSMLLRRERGTGIALAFVLGFSVLPVGDFRADGCVHRRAVRHIRLGTRVPLSATRLATLLGAGFTPVILVSLQAATDGSTGLVAAYMIALAVVSSVFIVLTKESKDRDLATYQH